jgi:hypothetical protein
MTHNQKNKVQYTTLNRICIMFLLVALYSVTILLPFHPKEVIAQRFGEDNSGGGFGGSDYLLYRDTTYGFTLTYPSYWQQTYETGVCVTSNCNYIISFSVGPEAVLRVFFMDVGNIPTNTYNNDYYDVVNQQQSSEIYDSQYMSIGDILPGGMMLYLTYTPDTNEPIGVLDSWGKYGNLGYLHFKFVAFEPDALTTYAPIAEQIVASFRME